jgi:predicted dehydrogenase
MNVGVLGCGVIAHRYVDGAAGFPSFDVVACADVDEQTGRAFADRHRLPLASVATLIADPRIDVVLNLTPPAAHAALVAATLAAGKHAYTEKPLAISVDAGRALLTQANESSMRIGCAPDTFLGAAYEAAREAIERGDIGVPIGANATMLTGGPEGWHPNADFFYRQGGGPLLDIGPYYLTAMVALLGRVEAASGFASTPTLERVLETGPRAGERFVSEVPTHVAAALRFSSGALGTLTVSFEARGRYESGLVVQGTEGALSLPDANGFGGDVQIRRASGDWESLLYDAQPELETRGLGLHEMIESVQAGRPHRASGELALHVLETMHAVLRSAEDGQTVVLA